MKMPAIREALSCLSSDFGVDRPLVQQRLWTNGAELFFEQFGRVMSVRKPRQLLLSDFEGYLARVDWEDGAMRRIFPFTREEIEGPRLIAIDPEISFGVPVVFARGVPTKPIADRYFAGEGIADLKEDYGCSQEEIEEAIRSEWMFRRAA